MNKLVEAVQLEAVNEVDLRKVAAAGLLGANLMMGQPADVQASTAPMHAVSYSNVLGQVEREAEYLAKYNFAEAGNQKQDVWIADTFCILNRLKSGHTKDFGNDVVSIARKMSSAIRNNSNQWRIANTIKHRSAYEQKVYNHILETMKEIATGKIKNPIGLATHFENVGRYGIPSWAKHMQIVKTIGAHTYFYDPKLWNHIKESIIDFPRPEGLSPDVWHQSEDAWQLKPEVEAEIWKIVSTYQEVELKELASEFHITGSICTNQWTDEADVDIHLVVDEKLVKLAIRRGEIGQQTPEEFQKHIMKWYKGKFTIGRHPVEVYIQYNLNQEFLAEGVFDFKNKTWIKGPNFKDADFDPYENFKEVADKVRAKVKSVDLEIGELKRDVIDYDTIRQAINRLPHDTQLQLKDELKTELEKIEADVDSLLKDKKEWADARKLSSQPTSPEQALNDVKLIKTWNDKNAEFKMLNRYQYIQLISDIEKAVGEDHKVDYREEQLIGKLLGVNP